MRSSGKMGFTECFIISSHHNGIYENKSINYRRQSHHLILQPTLHNERLWVHCLFAISWGPCWGQVRSKRPVGARAVHQFAIFSQHSKWGRGRNRRCPRTGFTHTHTHAHIRHHQFSHLLYQHTVTGQAQHRINNMHVTSFHFSQ